MAPCRRQRAFHGIARLGFERKLRGLRARMSAITSICIFSVFFLQETERAAWRLKCATFDSRLSHKNRQNDPLVRCLCVRFEHCKSSWDPVNGCEREAGQCAFSKSRASRSHPRLAPPPALIYATRVPRQPAYGAPAFHSIWGKARCRESEESEKSEKKQVVGSHSRTHLPPVHAPD